MKLVRLVSLAIGSLLLVSTFAFAQEGGSEAMDEAKRQYRNGNYQAAIDELTYVTDEAPDRADAFYLLGYSHLMLRQYPDSIEAFARAFQLDPELDPRTIYQQRSSME